MANLHFIVPTVSAIFSVLLVSSWMQGSNCIGMFVVELRTVQMAGHLCRRGLEMKMVFVVDL